MKTFIYSIGLIIFVFAFQSCGTKGVRGNGNIQSYEVNISDYDKLSFSGGSTIIFEQKSDESPYLKIEIDDNLYPLLIINSDSNTLSIKSKENIKPTKYYIYTNSKQLSKFSGSGSVKAHLKGKIVSQELEFAISGSGNITCDDIEAYSITSKFSGSSEITLAGKTESFKSMISGSGKVKAEKMIADNVECTVSGSGNFFVHANKNLEVKVSGSGNVRYTGNPKVNQSISGSGKVIDAN